MDRCREAYLKLEELLAEDYLLVGRAATGLVVIEPVITPGFITRTSRDEPFVPEQPAFTRATKHLDLSIFAASVADVVRDIAPRSTSVQRRVNKYDPAGRGPVRIDYCASETAKYRIRAREAAGQFSSVYAVSPEYFQPTDELFGHITYGSVPVAHEVQVSTYVLPWEDPLGELGPPESNPMTQGVFQQHPA